MKIDFIGLQDAVTFTDQSPEGYRHRYEKIRPGQPSSHNEETCVYCIHRAAQEPARRAARLANVEAAFAEAGVGRDDMEVDSDAYSDEGDEEEMAIDLS